MPDDICFAGARGLAGDIRARRVSARDVMAAHLEQIHRLNPPLTAIVAALPDDRCLAMADDADRQVRNGESLGSLHGLPIAFKDVHEAVGFPCTRGSPIFRTLMPTKDAPVVERLRRAGAIPIGKTNVPEFGMGSHTYNHVYGTTVNPWDPTRTAGGSSGGAAAAVASGMLPIADGTDLGGSLRNPAGFTNVVGFRPTTRLAPTEPVSWAHLDLSVNGPIARSVDDAAFLLGAMAGEGFHDPGTGPSDSSAVNAPVGRGFDGIRVAWCPDLGGLPLDPDVRSVLERQRATVEDLGCVVEDACPDLTDADEIFLTIRAWKSAAAYGHLLAGHRHQMKPEAVAEVEAGLALGGDDVARAMTRHGQLLERVRLFQERYAFLCCAVSQVPPFDAALPWPQRINGVAMDHYVAWMKSSYWISVTLRPAISVPAGFTSGGLPVGIQLVGRHGDDIGVLQFAHAFEQATGFGRIRPPVSGPGR